jgi:plastocyanin domain-containing protein
MEGLPGISSECHRARITDISFTQNGTVGYTCGWNGMIGKIENGTYTTQQVSFPDYESIAFTPSGDYGWTTACFGRKVNI